MGIQKLKVPDPWYLIGKEARGGIVEQMKMNE